MFLRLPRAYWILWAGTLVNRFGTFVGPFLALYLTHERGLGIARTGLIITLFGCGMVGAGPVGGILADRLGRRPTMLLGLVLGAVGMLLLGRARSIGAISLCTLGLGFVGDLYRPAVSASIADLVAPEERARAYALLYWVINLGCSVGLVVAGLIAARGYGLLFDADAATTLAFAILVALFVPESRPEAKVESARPRLSLLAPYHDRIFLVFAGLSFGVMALFQQCGTALPIDLGAHGIGPAMYGRIIAVNGALIVALQPAVIPFLAGRRAGPVLALSALLIGGGLGTTALAHRPLQYVASIVVWTLGELLMSPIGPTLVAELAPVELRGSYQGAYHVAWGAATLLGPALGATVLARFGGSILWGGCCGLGALLAFGHLWAEGPRAKRLRLLDEIRQSTK